MGLNHKSTGTSVLGETKGLSLPQRTAAGKTVIALAGNPNVGKSTIFNGLTGMNQHTGNWPGKTVANAVGEYQFQGQEYLLVDIPGTYSLMANSVEEEIARDFICFGSPDVVVIVADATTLERNLNLVLQILEITPRAVLCVNLLDEAQKKKIHIDLPLLSTLLGVSVVGASALSGKGLQELQQAVANLSAHPLTPPRLCYEKTVEQAVEATEKLIRQQVTGKLPSRWTALKLLDMDPALQKSLKQYLGFDLWEEVKNQLPAVNQEAFRDSVVGSINQRASQIYQQCVHIEKEAYHSRDRKIDRILTSKITGIPIMLALLALIFWLTISGANYPSQLLSSLFSFLENQLTQLFFACNAPLWLHGLLVEGMFRTLGWVISVMLPPMAIFFPLFTLLEDVGYLPRVAFNLDKFFKSCHACGKQSLTICMGFGCNACGVIGCRIIDSPRERLIAILTNSFVPCNGRFPTMISLITIFFVGLNAGFTGTLVSTLFLTAIILLGIFMTLLVSKILSSTILKGMPSSFALELPPYRRPQIGKVIVRSIFDRTLFVLGRAVSVAAPAGLLIWLMANITINGTTVLAYCTNFLDPLGRLLGMDGVILTAFILGFPANEIVIPLILMAYAAGGSMVEATSLWQLKDLLVANGWTALTALCTMLFSLLHFPCATTCLTIHKETGSWKWTALAFFLPTLIGMAICFFVATIGRFLC